MKGYWRHVPVEPTELMLKAGADVAAPARLEWNGQQQLAYFAHVRAIYEAMLEVAPKRSDAAGER